MCLCYADLLHGHHGGAQGARGGRSLSPGASHYPSSSSPSSSSTTTEVTKAEPQQQQQSHDSQVDSWEDIDDTPPPRQTPVPDTTSEGLTPSYAGTTETELKPADSQSNSSSGRSTPNKLQEHPVVKEGAGAISSSSLSSSSTPDLAKVERKQPSPALGGGALASRGEGGPLVGRGNKHGQAPPPKNADEKENINIVFIGQRRYVCIYSSSLTRDCLEKLPGCNRLETWVYVHVHNGNAVRCEGGTLVQGQCRDRVVRTET